MCGRVGTTGLALLTFQHFIAALRYLYVAWHTNIANCPRAAISSSQGISGGKHHVPLFPNGFLSRTKNQCSFISLKTSQGKRIYSNTLLVKRLNLKLQNSSLFVTKSANEILLPITLWKDYDQHNTFFVLGVLKMRHIGAHETMRTTAGPRCVWRALAQCTLYGGSQQTLNSIVMQIDKFALISALNRVNTAQQINRSRLRVTKRSIETIIYDL